MFQGFLGVLLQALGILMGFDFAPFYRPVTLTPVWCTPLGSLPSPLSPNSDQYQFSPNNIHRLSSATSMGINQMITKRRISDLLSISPNLFCKEMYRDQFGEFVCGYWGLITPAKVRGEGESTKRPGKVI